MHTNPSLASPSKFRASLVSASTSSWSMIGGKFNVDGLQVSCGLAAVALLWSLGSKSHTERSKSEVAVGGGCGFENSR